MRSWITGSVLLATVCALHYPAGSWAQEAASPSAQSAGDIKPCSAPSSSNKAQAGPEITVAELAFQGDLHLTIAQQDEIAESLKQQTYSGDPDLVAKEIADKVKAAWQEHGYFQARTDGQAEILTNAPGTEQIAIKLRIDEGKQYRLQEITFKNGKGISNPTYLRSMFPLNDGDVFNVAQVRKGLENLRHAYSELGYVTFTAVPDTRINEERQTVALNIDLDEGKQFYIEDVRVVGLDRSATENLLQDFRIKPGKIFNGRLVELFLKEHESLLPANASIYQHIYLKIDNRLATIAITYDFRECPVD